MSIIQTSEELDAILDRIGLLPLSAPRLVTILSGAQFRERELLGKSLSFRGDSHLDAIVFNDRDDTDEYRILEKAPARSSRTRISPAIEPSEQYAWIRYRFQGTLSSRKARARAKLKLGVSGNREITLVAYRRHDPTTTVAEAVGRDLVRARSILRERDLDEIGPGDALALISTRSLKLSLTLSLADIYSNVLTRIRWVGRGQPVAMRIDTRATLSIPFEISDSLMTVVSKTSDDELRFAIRKSADQKKGAKLTISISAGLGSPKAISEALSSFVSHYFGVPVAKLHRILSKTSLEDLDPTERVLVEQLIREIGLEDELTTLREIASFVEEFEENVAEAIRDVISAKIRGSFRYEYSKIDERDDLISIIVRRQGLTRGKYDEACRELHGSFIRGDVDAIVEQVQSDRDRYDVQQFFRETSTTSKSTLAFSLGVGDWKLSVVDSETVALQTRSDIEGRKLVTLDCDRRYRSNAGAFRRTEWSVDFRAAMKEWEAEPRSAHFDFSLSFLLRQTYSRFSAKTSADMIHLAMLWRVLDRSDRGWAIDQIETLEGKRGVTATLRIGFDEDALRRIFAMIDSAERPPVSLSLAAALPGVFKRSASDSEEQTSAFAPLIERALGGRRLSRAAIHRASASVANELNANRLASRELDAAKGTTADAKLPGSVIANHPDLHRDWGEFVEGARLLSMALDSGSTHYLRIADIARLLRPMWSRTWYARALPSYLMTLAASVGIDHAIDASLRFDSAKEDDEPVSVVIARS